MTRQKRLPGTDQGLIKEIVDAADDYEELRDQRMELLKKEIDAKEALLQIMKTNKLKEYTYEGKTITVTEKEDVKVRAIKISKDGDGKV